FEPYLEFDQAVRSDDRTLEASAGLLGIQCNGEAQAHRAYRPAGQCQQHHEPLLLRRVASGAHCAWARAVRADRAAVQILIPEEFPPDAITDTRRVDCRSGSA